MFAVRIVTTDHYQGTPVPGLDVQYSDFRGSEVRKVPVIRVFGATSAGQKTCMHVHGVFPYLYVPYDGTQPWDRYLRLFAASLDKAINVAQGHASANIHHVYKITLVSGIPMYGYHEKEQQFLKIYFYNPGIIRKAADLLLGGAVMNKGFQPHESHIPYNLQMFIDYNLYGMNMISVAAVKFRRKNLNDEVRSSQGSTGDQSNPRTPVASLQDLINTSIPVSTNQIWDEESIPSDYYLDENVTRQSTCELEVDIVAADILNRLEVDDKAGTNPGLAALWEDEKQRKRNLGESSQINPPESQEREDVQISDSDETLQRKFQEIVLNLRPYLDSQSDTMSESSQEDVPPTPSASDVDLHLSQDEDDLQESQDTVILDEEEIEAPIVNMDSIHRVVSMSQSFSGQPSSQPLNEAQDRSLAQILASLADEDSPSSSQAAESEVTVLEEKDSILQDQAHVPDDDVLKQDEDEILEMSQIVWDDGSQSDDSQKQLQDKETEVEGFNVEGMDTTWVDSQDSDNVLAEVKDGEEEDEEEDLRIPQLDGANDEKPTSATKKSKKKRLGVTGPVVPGYNNPVQQGHGQAGQMYPNQGYSMYNAQGNSVYGMSDGLETSVYQQQYQQSAYNNYGNENYTNMDWNQQMQYNYSGMQSSQSNNFGMQNWGQGNRGWTNNMMKSSNGNVGNSHGNMTSPHGSITSPHGNLASPHGSLNSPHGNINSPGHGGIHSPGQINSSQSHMSSFSGHVNSHQMESSFDQFNSPLSQNNSSQDPWSVSQLDSSQGHNSQLNSSSEQISSVTSPNDQSSQVQLTQMNPVNLNDSSNEHMRQLMSPPQHTNQMSSSQGQLTPQNFSPGQMYSPDHTMNQVQPQRHTNEVNKTHVDPSQVNTAQSHLTQLGIPQDQMNSSQRQENPSGGNLNSVQRQYHMDQSQMSTNEMSGYCNSGNVGYYDMQGNYSQNYGYMGSQQSHQFYGNQYGLQQHTGIPPSYQSHAGFHDGTQSMSSTENIHTQQFQNMSKTKRRGPSKPRKPRQPSSKPRKTSLSKLLSSTPVGKEINQKIADQGSLTVTRKPKGNSGILEKMLMGEEEEEPSDNLQRSLSRNSVNSVCSQNSDKTKVPNTSANHGSSSSVSSISSLSPISETKNNESLNSYGNNATTEKQTLDQVLSPNETKELFSSPSSRKSSSVSSSLFMKSYTSSINSSSVVNVETVPCSGSSTVNVNSASHPNPHNVYVPGNRPNMTHLDPKSHTNMPHPNTKNISMSEICSSSNIIPSVSRNASPSVSSTFPNNYRERQLHQSDGGNRHSLTSLQSLVSSVSDENRFGISVRNIATDGKPYNYNSNEFNMYMSSNCMSPPPPPMATSSVYPPSEGESLSYYHHMDSKVGKAETLSELIVQRSLSAKGMTSPQSARAPHQHDKFILPQKDVAREQASKQKFVARPSLVRSFSTPITSPFKEKKRRGRPPKSLSLSKSRPSVDSVKSDTSVSDIRPVGSKYTFSFHVPTPVYKRLKCLHRRSSQAFDDIKVVRMHPRDARRYSLLKIGREIVKIPKLSSQNIEMAKSGQLVELESLLQECTLGGSVKRKQSSEDVDSKCVNLVDSQSRTLTVGQLTNSVNTNVLSPQKMIVQEQQLCSEIVPENLEKENCHNIQKITLSSIIESVLRNSIDEEDEWLDNKGASEKENAQRTENEEAKRENRNSQDNNKRSVDGNDSNERTSSHSKMEKQFSSDIEMSSNLHNTQHVEDENKATESTTKKSTQELDRSGQLSPTNSQSIPQHTQEKPHDKQHGQNTVKTSGTRQNASFILAGSLARTPRISKYQDQFYRYLQSNSNIPAFEDEEICKQGFDLSKSSSEFVDNSIADQESLRIKNNLDTKPSKKNMLKLQRKIPRVEDLNMDDKKHVDKRNADTILKNPCIENKLTADSVAKEKFTELNISEEEKKTSTSLNEKVSGSDSKLCSRKSDMLYNQKFLNYIMCRGNNSHKEDIPMGSMTGFEQVSDSHDNSLFIVKSQFQNSATDIHEKVAKSPNEVTDLRPQSLSSGSSPFHSQILSKGCLKPQTPPRCMPDHHSHTKPQDLVQHKSTLPRPSPSNSHGVTQTLQNTSDEQTTKSKQSCPEIVTSNNFSGRCDKSSISISPLGSLPDDRNFTQIKNCNNSSQVTQVATSAVMKTQESGASGMTFEPPNKCEMSIVTNTQRCLPGDLDSFGNDTNNTSDDSEPRSWSSSTYSDSKRRISRERKNRSCYSDSDFIYDLGRKRKATDTEGEKQKRRRLIPGVDFIVTGKFKGHRRMAVHVEKLNISNGTVVHVSDYLNSRFRDREGNGIKNNGIFGSTHDNIFEKFQNCHEGKPSSGTGTDESSKDSTYFQTKKGLLSLSGRRNSADIIEISSSDESNSGLCSSENTSKNITKKFGPNSEEAEILLDNDDLMDIKDSYDENDSDSADKQNKKSSKKKKKLTKNQRLHMAFTSASYKTRRKKSPVHSGKLMTSLSLLHEATIANLVDPVLTNGDSIDDYKDNYEDVMFKLSLFSPANSDKGDNSPPQPLSPEEFSMDHRGSIWSSSDGRNFALENGMSPTSASKEEELSPVYPVMSNSEGTAVPLSVNESPEKNKSAESSTCTSKESSSEQRHSPGSSDCLQKVTHLHKTSDEPSKHQPHKNDESLSGIKCKEDLHINCSELGENASLSQKSNSSLDSVDVIEPSPNANETHYKHKHIKSDSYLGEIKEVNYSVYNCQEVRNTSSEIIGKLCLNSPSKTAPVLNSSTRVRPYLNSPSKIGPLHFKRKAVVKLQPLSPHEIEKYCSGRAAVDIMEGKENIPLTDNAVEDDMVSADDVLPPDLGPPNIPKYGKQEVEELSSSPPQLILSSSPRSSFTSLVKNDKSNTETDKRESGMDSSGESKNSTCEMDLIHASDNSPKDNEDPVQHYECEADRDYHIPDITSDRFVGFPDKTDSIKVVKQKDESSKSREDNSQMEFNDDEGKDTENVQNGEKIEKKMTKTGGGSKIHFTPVRRPPTRQSVKDTAAEYGLRTSNNQPAFCSNPEDVPEKPRELGGRVLNLQSNRVSSLPDFESTVKCQGITTHRKLMMTNDHIFDTQTDNDELMHKFIDEPELRFALLGDRTITIMPCQPAPSRASVEAWSRKHKLYKKMKMLKESKDKKNNKVNSDHRDEQKSSTDGISVQATIQRTGSDNGQAREACTVQHVSHCENVQDNDDNGSDMGSPTSVKIVKILRLKTDQGNSFDFSQEKDIISPSPPSDKLKVSRWDRTETSLRQSQSSVRNQLTDSPVCSQLFVNVDGSNQVGKSPLTPEVGSITKSDNSNYLPSVETPKSVKESNFHSTPLLKKKLSHLFETAVTPIANKTGENLERVTPKHDKENCGESSPGFVTPRQIPLPRRLSSTNERSLRGSLSESQMKQFATQLNKKGSVSQIDAPTPKNSFGFKVSQQNLQDAKALHEVQNLTVISLELHAESRRDLRPDPEVDAILAVFYEIHNDTASEKAEKRISGAILLDKKSSENQKEWQRRRKQKSEDTTDTDTTVRSDSPKPSTSHDSASSSNKRSQSPQPSTSADARSKVRASPTPPRRKKARSRSPSPKPARVPKPDDQYIEDTLLQRSGVDGDLQVTYVENEQELFDTFIDLVHRWDPDILVGYEIQNFSWGYLFQRASHLSINLCAKLSRIPEEKKGSSFKAESDEWGADHSSEIHVAGRITLNLWRLLRHEVALNIYTFENVSFHVLHQRVPHFSFQTLNSWFQHRTHLHRWRFVQHYQTRVKGNMQIIDQLDLIGRTSEFARVFGIEFYHVLSRGSQYRVESMMLRLAKPLNFIPVSPSVQQRARMRAPECIALTMEPESRFYSDPVVVLDFQSLYPSIMIAHNYCFSTCVGRLEFLKKAHEGAIELGSTHLRISPSTLNRIKDDVTVSPNGVVFVKQHVRKGIISNMVEEILKTRIMVKKGMKEHKKNKGLHRLLDARQLGLKLIANVTYGYTAANFSGRMPCVEVADSIVRKARETLERAIQLVEDTPQWGARVVYGDTDSMFIELKGRSKEEAFRIGYEICDAVTEMNPKPMKLKFEKVYFPCVLQTKKRYVGYSYETPDQKEPIFDAKGIETVRRDSCAAVSKILERTIKILFNTKDVSLVKEYVLRQCKKLMEGKVSMQDCIFAKEYRGMKGYKPGACVPALEISKKLLRQDRRAEPRVGERVPYVIVYGSPGLPLIQLVRQPQEVLNDATLRLNATYYIVKQILPPLDRLFSLLGVNVFMWYNDMPKVTRVAPMTSVLPQTKKGTISQYFQAANCPVCDKQTNQSICAECMKSPSLVSVTLCERISAWEKVYHDLTQICNTCMGCQDEKQPCDSLDCPIMFRRLLAKRDVNKGADLRDVITKMLDF